MRYVLYFCFCMYTGGAYKFHIRMGTIRICNLRCMLIHTNMYEHLLFRQSSSYVSITVYIESTYDDKTNLKRLT